MITFLRETLASMVGVFIGGLLVFLVGLAIVVASVKGDNDDTAEIKPNSILSLDLSGQFHERGDGSKSDLDEEISGLLGLNPTGLWELRKALQHAKEDENIKGIYINTTSSMNGWATLESIREALIDFKSSGKFIVAYSELMDEKAYYLASVAEEIYLYPQGGMEFNGLAANPMFYKGLLEKLEIEPKIFRVGTFKSAVEPFMLDKMSDANRLQTETFITDFWNYYLGKIGEARKLTPEKLNEIANAGGILTTDEAVRYGLVNSPKYLDEIHTLLRTKIGIDEKEKLPFVSLKKYLKSFTLFDKKSSENKIAVIFAEGEIVDGEGGDNQIGSTSLADAIRKAREDKSVKGIVLRVNSPGGSALASDVIWREISITKLVKPIVASMGDVAASGGYYISANCDYIYAQPNTITGSIGVFGLLANTEKFFKNKLGITFDRVTTNNFADLGQPNKPMSKEEEKLIQKNVDKIYGVFIHVVQNGRKFQDSLSVDSIAQGRVWSGIRAKDIGLVDAFGGLDDAIKKVAELANLGEDYKITTLPKQDSPLSKILSDKEETAIQQFRGKMDMHAEIEAYLQFKRIFSSRMGTYTIMPYTWDIH